VIKKKSIRPWYISFTALWKDAKNFEYLREMLFDDLGCLKHRPAHHLPVRKDEWHSTIFAVLRINGWDEKKYRSAEDNALTILRQLVSTCKTEIETLKASFTPFSLEAYELVCFDNGMAVQFRQTDGTLSKFRKTTENALSTRIKDYCNHINESPFGSEWQRVNDRSIVESLSDDLNKNQGGNAFGSVARSSHPDDVRVVRWRMAIGPIELTFKKLYLLQSDETLSNPLAIEKAELFEAT
jgi:hypothetical protein